MQHNWESREAREKLSDAQAVLHEVRQQKFQFQENAILSKWTRVGDRCTKEFFEFHEGPRQAMSITRLTDGVQTFTTQSELESHILAFYKQLYTRDNQVEEAAYIREACLQLISQPVTSEHNQELIKPITLEEVTAAVKQLPAGKSPGTDTIPAEFYQALWEDIDGDILNFVTESIEHTHIAAELNISKIALLPKSEDRSRVQNFRPISLLNTPYKIVAKILANRMKPLLHHWILPSQTGFVPNRCILDNIFLVFEAIEWTLENYQDLSMLLLDFEKAYDRVNWTFLRQVMTRMDFHPNWVNQVMALNEYASAAIIVNGEQSQTFNLERSVRQGCPLAPYLFLLTVDVLGQMLQHPACGVKGLNLPDKSNITNQMFADDTLLFLDGTKDNMDKALTVINRFGAASGAKLNLHKSVGLWLSHHDRTWQWGEEEGMKWLLPGEVTKYLGYPFGLHIPQKEKDGKMLSQIRKHLSKWTNHPLSLAGRIMIANQVVLSSIWYFASCTDYTGKTLKIAKATVRNYIWSGKKESCARAKVKWDTAVLPIVRGGIKILDPQWQTSALPIKLLTRGLSPGYEPWKTLIRFRVAQTRQSRRGRWPAHSNWIMNARNIVKQGSALWQGVLKAWQTIQSGIEQQDPTTWDEIIWQPLYGNRFLTNEQGIQWGTDSKTNMKYWAERAIWSIKDMVRDDGNGWKPFIEQEALKRSSTAPQLYNRILRSIPWQPRPFISMQGLWIAAKEEDGSIRTIYHITKTDPIEATVYDKTSSEQLQHIANSCPLPVGQFSEVRIARCGGPRRMIIDYNPQENDDQNLTFWMWGDDWVCNLEWDPKEWQWRRIGVLPDTTILNYCTKRGYRAALKQNNHSMKVDKELEEAGYNSKVRAKFFNRIWHPYLPRKVSAMQWLILTEGLPVGAWRERVGLPNNCQICPTQDKETLPHAFKDCTEIKRVWDLFRNTRHVAGLPPSYNTWKEISRGLLNDPPGPSMEESLRWDTAAAFSITIETPWDMLRANLLWAIWCQRVEIAFREEHFHLGVILWQAWRTTIYGAMEAYKELFRHNRNEEKRQELISCFQKIWTQAEIFARLRGGDLKWNLTPHKDFLPIELGAWMTPPIRINRTSPSPDPEAEFTARADFSEQVDEFLQGIINNMGNPDPPIPAAAQDNQENYHQPAGSPRGQANAEVNHRDPPRTDEQASPQPAQHPQLAISSSPFMSPTEQRTHETYRGKENEDPSQQIHPGQHYTLPQTHIANWSRGMKSRPKRKCFKQKTREHTYPATEPSEPQHSTSDLRQQEAAVTALSDTIAPSSDHHTPVRSPSSTAEARQHNRLDTPSPLSQAQPSRTSQQRTDRLQTCTGKENRKPEARTEPTDYTPLSRKTSRPKKKCYRLKHQPTHDPMDDLPIERDLEATTSGQCSRAVKRLPQGGQHHSRPKRRCLFGPGRQGQEASLRPPGRAKPGTTNCAPTSMFRTTLTHPYWNQRMPFDKYKGIPPPPPQPNPYRFIHRKLGISEAEFDARIEQDIEDMFLEIENERRQALLESLPCGSALSKADCRKLFPRPPAPRSLRGIYYWAHDIDPPDRNADPAFDATPPTHAQSPLRHSPSARASPSSASPPLRLRATLSETLAPWASRPPPPACELLAASRPGPPGLGVLLPVPALSPAAAGALFLLFCCFLPGHRHCPVGLFPPPFFRLQAPVVPGHYEVTSPPSSGLYWLPLFNLKVLPR